MARFDRYLLSQLLILFGFFALVLVAIYWINNAVRLFDRLIADGQTAAVFLEFSALTLPNVIRITLPMSAFAAAVYVTNRLSSESELVVMQATGFSPWRLARPVLYFGLIIGAVMSLMTHYLAPQAQAQMTLRNREIANNLTARLLTEGSFLHPSDGVTFFIREITADGALLDIFLSDRRDPAEPRSYTATRAYIVAAEDDSDDVAGGEAQGQIKLVMLDGLAQTLDATTERLFTTHFAEFSYDITAMVRRDSMGAEAVRNLSTRMLLFNPQRAQDLTGSSRGLIAQEAHGRFQQALLCLVAALVGFAALIVGGFSRFGVWRQIIMAVLILVVIKFVEGIVTDPVRQNAAMWPLIYVPTLVGMAITALLLWIAGRPRRVRRGGAPDPAAEAPA
ncbi:LPS export ABC transporter permease LptF [Pseudooceanicola aestuarii]|uniref:LPS export ABC transporter permease LptF n=1 Tax=Pseudooceanicola aestuarii TaxID=2697319 RepID=UPI0013CF643D|nr:LPS export ABC transporter permease LptF [Pseudooceanicola aestuarii]